MSGLGPATRLGRRERPAGALLGLVLLLTVACDSFSIRMHLKSANKLYNAQKYEEAVPQYQEILRIEPDHWQANYLLAACFLALYHPGSKHEKDLEYATKGIAAFERLLALEPPSEEDREKIRNFYLGLLTSAGENKKATDFMAGLLAADPANTMLMSQLATLYAKQGDFSNALKYFDMRAEAEPNSKEAWYTVGVVCWDRSYNGGLTVSHEEREVVVAKGLEALQRALSLDPHYFDALSYVNLLYREKSKVLVALGKYEEAQAAYQTAEEYMKKALEARKQNSAAPKSGG